MDKTMTNTRNKGWEPKDGDVCFLSAKYNHLFIFRKFEHGVVKSYVHIVFHADAEISKDVCNINEIEEFRPATDLERLNFFNLMAEEGKMWDAENKKVVDYPMWDIRKGGNHESEN